jgi:hypothetical protein
MVFSIMVIGLTGFVALVTDVGFAYKEKQDSQKAADAAALAAAGVLRATGVVEDAEAEALAIAAANGYEDGVDGITVEVNIPPDSGPHTGISNYAEVEIGSGSDAYFSQVLGFEAFDVDARAVAGGIGVNGDYGIVALNPTVCKALDLNGNIGIEIHAAGIFVNSNCPTDAFWANGNVTVHTEVNSVVGGSEGVGTIVIDPPPTPADPITDPLAHLPVPTLPTTVRTCPGSWTGTITLEPGVYDCQLDPAGSRSIIFQPGSYHITGGIVANGGGNITFGAGEYTIGGTGLTVNGGGRITVNNALLYIEAGEADLTGNGVTRLLAPTSGPYTGISIFQSRTNTTQVDIAGTSLTAGAGAVYAAAAKASLVGNSGSSNMQFVVDMFSMSGAATLELQDEENILIYQSALRLVE